jgi:uncharacterized protein
MTTSLKVPIEAYDPAQLPRTTTTPGHLTVALDLDLELPVITVRGAAAGRTALFVAGVHGDEFEGIAALSRAARRLDPRVMSGDAIFLPVCNPLAFGAQSRCTPSSVDGANLARVFPGNVDGTPTERLAFAIFSLTTRLLTPDDLVVDLHSGGTRYRYLMLAGFREIDGPARKASEEAARRFGAADEVRLWAMRDEHGMFNAETTRIGLPTIGAEAPGQGECRADDVSRYEAGVANLLRHLEILPGGAPVTGATAKQPVELTCPYDGLFLAERSTGSKVHVGERVGTIIDTLGEPKTDILAPRSGEIWALRTFSSVCKGELLAWIA